MYHLDSKCVTSEWDVHCLWKGSHKMAEYWSKSHEKQDLSGWYFSVITVANPNTPIHAIARFTHSDVVCIEKKHSTMDPFYKFGIYVKDIPGSISSFGLGKKSGGIHSNEAVGLKIPYSNESTGLQSNNPLGACPWCQKLSTNRLTLSNHIRWEHYHLTLICHMCGTYHMPY